MRHLTLIAALTLLLAGSGAYAQNAAAPPTPAPAPAQPSSTAPTAQPVPAGSVLLQYKFQPGEVLKYNLTMGMNMAIAMGAQSMPMTMNSTMTMDQTVQSVDAQGNATILAKAENPTMTMMLNGNPMPAPPNAMSQITSGFTEVMSPLGKVISFKSNAPAAQSPASPMPTGNMFSPGQLGSLSALPDHPVKPGDFWRASADMGAVGMQMFVKMSLVSLDDSSGSEVADIAQKYYATFSPAAKPGMPAMHGTLTGTGNSTFDVDKGVMTATTANMETDMSMAGADGAPSPAGLGNVKMNMTIQMDLVAGP